MRVMCKIHGSRHHNSYKCDNTLVNDLEKVERFVFVTCVISF